MKQEILSWNTFTLVSTFHCLCVRLWTYCIKGNCVYRENISSDSENLKALVLISNISC